MPDQAEAEAGSGATIGTYYVLDVLCWKGQPLYETGAEFRAFWRTSRLMEISGLESVHPTANRHAIVNLGPYPCDAHGLAAAVESGDLTLDGLLLFHKEGHYAPGTRSPLVLWLEAHLLPSFLSEVAR